jgi:signal transduction histidine kinase
MHDVVAHQLSLMTVQAGAARTIAGKNPEAAIEAMAAVEQAGRRALSEMRQLLSVLRPNPQQIELAPQPGVGDIPALCEQAREVGLSVSLDIEPAIGAPSPRHGLTLYRLVQEALTNVIKHAGKGADVSIVLTRNACGYKVTIRDSGQGPGAPHSGGHGLVGMRERVELLGGELSAGASATGGFQVIATLPSPDAEKTEQGDA